MKKLSISGSKNSFFVFLLSSFLVSIITNAIMAQEELDVFHLPKTHKDHWLGFSDVKNSLYHHITSDVYQLLEERNEQVRKIGTKAEWEARQKRIKENLIEILGPFPPKTPLNAKVVRTIQKDEYTIEHIIFESRPDYYVTSSLFIPAGKEKNAPTIIYCSGHTAEAYRNETYQHIILNLVKKGFIVFAFDPPGQGERLQYYDAEKGSSLIGGPTHEHSYPGAQLFLTGNSLAGYMTWDGIRAVDYLLTRKEVDPDRIGITGRSGGGTQTSYIAAVDDRIYAAAPECFITNSKMIFQSMGPQDAEQNLFHGIKRGIDHPDFLTVRAPKPTLMITTVNDFFSIHGARQTAKEVARVYKAYNSADNFGMVEDLAGHMSTEKNREAMYAFFQKHLNNPGIADDEEVELLTPEELQVTEAGQVSESLNSETIYSLNKKEAEKLVEKLNTSRGNIENHLTGLEEKVKKISGYLEFAGIDEPVYTGCLEREGYKIEKYYLRGEGDYPVPYLLFRPEESNQKVVIYLHPEGKAVEAGENGEIAFLVKNGFTVLAPDLLWIGETGPGDLHGDAYIHGVSYNIWFAAIHLGRSITGIRAGDVNRLVQMIQSTFPNDEIMGLAREQMAPVLLHAAAFNDAVSSVALVRPYSS